MNSLRKQIIRNPFKNQEGKIAVVQLPNWQLWVIIIIYILKIVVTDNNLLSILKAAHFMVIVIWAYEELARGDNLFRRALGALVLIATFLSILHYFK